MDINALFGLALAALKKEDESLRDTFPQQGHEEVAHGLTYWLFETTLVYFIFKAWIPKTNVVWEHALEKDVRRRPDPNVEGRMGAHEKCDLVVMEGDQPIAAFEAKWWNVDGAKIRRSLLADAAKLRRHFPAEIAKYLITFWWSEGDTFAADTAAAREFCASEGLKFVKADQFCTQLRGGAAGYFVLCLLEVRQ
jgi:hypothetical protein